RSEALLLRTGSASLPSCPPRGDVESGTGDGGRIRTQLADARRAPRPLGGRRRDAPGRGRRLCSRRLRRRAGGAPAPMTRVKLSACLTTYNRASGLETTL